MTNREQRVIKLDDAPFGPPDQSEEDYLQIADGVPVVPVGMLEARQRWVTTLKPRSRVYMVKEHMFCEVVHPWRESVGDAQTGLWGRITLSTGQGRPIFVEVDPWGRRADRDMILLPVVSLKEMVEYSRDAARLLANDYDQAIDMVRRQIMDQRAIDDATGEGPQPASEEHGPAPVPDLPPGGFARQECGAAIGHTAGLARADFA